MDRERERERNEEKLRGRNNYNVCANKEIGCGGEEILRKGESEIK